MGGTARARVCVCVLCEKEIVPVGPRRILRNAPARPPAAFSVYKEAWCPLPL